MNCNSLFFDKYLGTFKRRITEQLLSLLLLLKAGAQKVEIESLTESLLVTEQN